MILQVHAQRWVFPDATNPHAKKSGGFQGCHLGFRGQHPAPVDVVVHPIVGSQGFFTSQVVVWDFFHQEYFQNIS